MNGELEQIRAVVDSLPDPVFILTESGRYADIFGGVDSSQYHDGSVLVGKSLFDVLPKDKAEWFLGQVTYTLRKARLQTVEYALQGEELNGLDTGNGPAGVLWFEGRIQPLDTLYDGERAVAWSARNVTERRTMEAKLRDLSEHDDLTGVYNRRKFIVELKKRFHEFQRYQAPMSLLMLDVDHFKTINDRFGHQVGDKVLIEVASTGKGLLRNTDLLSRFGGEEFVFLLPQTSQAQAMVLAERIRSAMSDISLSPDLQVTVSLGVTEFLASDTETENIIRRADQALYAAKHAGRNRVIVSEQIEKTAIL